MTGKRSLRQPWWARRDTLLAAGGTAVAVWIVVGAWMLVHPGGSEVGPTTPETTPTSILETPSSADTPDGGYDPGVYNGPLNTPTFTPHPSRTPTGTGQPSTGGTTSGPQPTPEPQPTATTTGPGHGHGHGHGKNP